MNTTKKVEVALVIGLAIPVVMILLVAGAIYAPRLFSGIEDPQYDFLYTVGYAQGYRLFVDDGRLKLDEPESECVVPASTGLPELQFFIHDVNINKSERLTFDQASLLRLDNTALSPDGYEFAYGRKSEFLFPMWSSRDYRTRYLRKDGQAIKLELETGESFSNAGTVTFLGWIEE